MGIVLDEFSCPEGANSYQDCGYKVNDHDCDHSEDVVLKCAGMPLRALLS